jgi:antitoxin FitA
MSTTLTIRNLEEPVKQKLRMRAASHGRSMEAEARDILTSAISNASNVAPHSDRQTTPPIRSDAASKNKGKFDHVIGIWKGRMTTDEIMQLTRGE